MKNFIVVIAALTFSTLAWNQETDMRKSHYAVLSEFYKTSPAPVTHLVAVNKQLLKINRQLFPQNFSSVSHGAIEQFTLTLYGASQLTMFPYKSRAVEHINQGVAKGTYSKDLAAIYQTLIERSPTKKMVLAIIKNFISQPRSDQDLKSIALFKTAYWHPTRFGRHRAQKIVRDAIHNSNCGLPPVSVHYLVPLPVLHYLI